jgi:transposase
MHRRTQCDITLGMQISFLTPPTSTLSDLLAELCARLFSAVPDTIRLETLLVAKAAISVIMTTSTTSAVCPDCGTLATRVHSRYDRTLADLPWASMPVQICLTVQRFFCDQASCRRATFTERLPTLAPPYARRTMRQTSALTQIGLALGGCAGARQAACQGMPTSRNTLLRLIRRLPPPPERAPTVIGIDDWARRKGQTYASIVVDLERHQPITLLEDRSAQTVEAWLQAHPTVTIISRDRSTTYAAAATAGAPDAIQVADRFHILKNLREAVEQELERNKIVVLRSVSDSEAALALDLPTSPGDDPQAAAALPRHLASPTTQQGPTTPSGSAIYPDTPSGQRAEAARQARRSERLAQYTRMVELQDQGLDQRTIARTVGISPRTLSRWSAKGAFPERRRRTGDTSALSPYKAELLERWQAGCHTIAHLWREIQSEGFSGSYGVVYEYLAPLRRGEPIRPSALEAPVPIDPTAQPSSYTARQLSFLLLRRDEELTVMEQQDLAPLQQENGDGSALYHLTQGFAQLMRDRAMERLDVWLQEAEESPFPELHSFVAGIRRDEAAVRAALELPWSQGQVEGQITKLKLLKRQMYGRAKLDLLQQRLLHAA